MCSFSDQGVRNQYASNGFARRLKNNCVCYLNPDFRSQTHFDLNKPLLSLAQALTKNEKLIFLPKLIPTNNPMASSNNNSGISTDAPKCAKTCSPEIPATDSPHYMKLPNCLFDKISKILAICNSDLLTEFTKSEY